MRAISRSSAVAPSRASTTNRTRSALVHRGEHLTAHALDQGSWDEGSKPPVSITVACQRSKLTRP
jgi:hypothetical protein